MRSNVLPMPADQRVPQDITEVDMHALIEIARDFEIAVVDATTVSRCLQISERMKVAVGLLERVGSAARCKADTF